MLLFSKKNANGFSRRRKTAQSIHSDNIHTQKNRAYATLSFFDAGCFASHSTQVVVVLTCRRTPQMTAVPAKCPLHGMGFFCLISPCDSPLEGRLTGADFAGFLATRTVHFLPREIGADAGSERMCDRVGLERVCAVMQVKRDGVRPRTFGESVCDHTGSERVCAIMQVQK
jgi:hypothetical protein